MRQAAGKVASALAVIELILGASQIAHAAGPSVKIKTPSVTPEPDGYVQCEVVASGRAPIGIIASIVADDGTNVTEYGTSFRAAPGVILDAYYAEETAGSFADDARSCKAVVTGALRRDVEVTLNVYDASGVLIATTVSH